MPAHASRHGLLPFGNPALMTSHETFREPEAGFGPATCALRGRRSDLLSYSGDARAAAAARETVPRDWAGRLKTGTAMRRLRKA